MVRDNLNYGILTMVPFIIVSEAYQHLVCFQWLKKRCSVVIVTMFSTDCLLQYVLFDKTFY